MHDLSTMQLSSNGKSDRRMAMGRTFVVGKDMEGQFSGAGSGILVDGSLVITARWASTTFCLWSLVNCRPALARTEPIDST